MYKHSESTSWEIEESDYLITYLINLIDLVGYIISLLVNQGDSHWENKSANKRLNASITLPLIN